MMSKKVSITLDDDVLDFVDQLARNRSSFINDVLWKEKQRVFMKELEESYTEQSNDPGFQEEIAVWDVAVGDGLNA
jgi:metal-responsive CopG/Arc/MetJ family transcriptional regulator